MRIMKKQMCVVLTDILLTKFLLKLLVPEHVIIKSKWLCCILKTGSNIKKLNSIMRLPKSLILEKKERKEEVGFFFLNSQNVPQMLLC